MGEAAEEIREQEAPESRAAESETTGEVRTEAAETEPKETAQEAGPVPLERFNKVYGEKKSLERKFELFRTDPEAYYQQYPDERPAAKAPAPPPIPQSLREVADFVVQGGDYHGKTFAEVYRVDPFAAATLYEDYRNSLTAEQRKAEEARTQAEEARKATEAEMESFGASMAKQMYGEADLTPEQQQEITTIVEDLAKWMIDNKKALLSMEEAYFLRNRDRILKGEQVKGINALAQALGGDGVPAVSGNKGDGGEVAGFGSYAAMSRNQIAANVERMDDRTYQKFLKEAPPAVRKKCPDLPWQG